MENVKVETNTIGEPKNVVAKRGSKISSQTEETSLQIISENKE